MPAAQTEKANRFLALHNRPGAFVIPNPWGVPISVAELAALGVRRISVGSALSRAALGAFVRAAREIREQGTFRFAEDALPSADANDFVVRS